MRMQRPESGFDAATPDDLRDTRVGHRASYAEPERVFDSGIRMLRTLSQVPVERLGSLRPEWARPPPVPLAGHDRDLAVPIDVADGETSDLASAHPRVVKQAD